MSGSGEIHQEPLSTGNVQDLKRDYIYLGFIGHAGNTVIQNVFNAPLPLVNGVNQLDDLASSIGPFSIEGNRISVNASNKKIDKTAGSSFFFGGNDEIDPKSPHILITNALSTSVIVTANQFNIFPPGTQGNSADGTEIPTDLYDDGIWATPIAPAVPNNWFSARIWHAPENNRLIYQYSQFVYNTEVNALEGFSREDFVLPPGLPAGAYVIAILVHRQNETDLDNATLVPQSKFSGTGTGGISVTTLQGAYNNSTDTEILTDSTRGAVTIVRASDSDNDNVLEIQNGNQDNTFQVQGDGDTRIAGNLIVTGSITAQEIHTTYESASIIYSSGSTKFGDTLDDTHQFTGSVSIRSGSFTFNSDFGDNDFTVFRQPSGTSLHIDGATGNIGFGDTAHTGLGGEKFQFHGKNNNAPSGGSLGLYTAASDYPTIQLYNHTQGNVGINFGMYYDGVWRSASSTKRPYRVYNEFDTLIFGSAPITTEGGSISSTRFNLIELVAGSNTVRINRSTVLNSDADDYDTIINKSGSGEAYKYDGGVDTHLFSGSLLSIDNSTEIGNDLSNTHNVTGSLSVTGSATFNILSITDLPTSPSGIPTGSIWNNGGALHIV